ncbi:MAG TPA: hypothetical protein VGJ41_14195 [Nocardioides sp.]|jgi:hypothetical protein
MSDNVMYDSPTEFLHEVAEHAGRCVAQSVIPLPAGGYRCACSCGRWEVIAPSRAEGLQWARDHTAATAAA